jgi:hypothetical protein
MSSLVIPDSQGGLVAAIRTLFLGAVWHNAASTSSGTSLR